jgi:hypothetical protein
MYFWSLLLFQEIVPRILYELTKYVLVELVNSCPQEHLAAFTMHTVPLLWKILSVDSLANDSM